MTLPMPAARPLARLATAPSFRVSWSSGGRPAPRLGDAQAPL